MVERDLANWTARGAAGEIKLVGAYCRLVPFVSDLHGAGLFAAVGGPSNDALWTYIPMGPYGSADELNAMLAHVRTERSWRTMVIMDASSDEIVGMASYMRRRPEHGSAEVGCVVFGPDLQRTRAATEALYLMARHVFEDLGYRRFEWKCNAANVASMRSALRFGFAFEGIFRNDMVVKGANRDTAWYSMVDSDWSRIDAGFQAWLNADNFDSAGKQLSKLTIPPAD